MAPCGDGGSSLQGLVNSREESLSTFEPLVVGFAWACVALAILVASERMVHIAVNLVMTFTRGDRPEAVGFSRGMLPSFQQPGAPPIWQDEDEWPTVLVQLPMFNEGHQAIGAVAAAAAMHWPASRTMVQVLDDSTDGASREKVDWALRECRTRGVRAEVHRRTNRQGYKAGALKEGMELAHVQGQFEFIAIFDADFRPDPDFLLKTVPYFDRQDVGLVQTRWSFLNAGESFLTRVQEIALNYHVKCEQYSRFAGDLFFNFNGTAGVWRTAAILDAGGWSGATVTEDMDLSLRAHVAGWKSVFLRNVTCDNEIPTDYQAYRNQQFRWTCGPMQVWRRVAFWSNHVNAEVGSRLGLLSRLWVLYFFAVSYLLSTILAALAALILIPLATISVEIRTPITIMAIVLAPAMLGACISTPTWRVDRYLGFMFFQNVMALLRVKAVLAGLRDTRSANSWVVTKKKGSASGDSKPSRRGQSSLLWPECFAGAAYIAAAGYAILHPLSTLVLESMFIAYLLIQGGMFILHGFRAFPQRGEQATQMRPVTDRRQCAAIESVSCAHRLEQDTPRSDRVGRRAALATEGVPT
jgi:beta-mannan synthase